MVASAHAPAPNNNPGGSPMNRSKLVVAAALLLGATPALAQQPPIPQYGPNVTLDQARKAAAAGEAEAKKNGGPMGIAGVDTAGRRGHTPQRGDGQAGRGAAAPENGA